MNPAQEARILQRAYRSWSRSLYQTALLLRDKIEDGDPDGEGLERLCGRVEAYEDAARTFGRFADELGQVRPDERQTRLLGGDEEPQQDRLRIVR